MIANYQSENGLSATIADDSRVKFFAPFSICHITFVICYCSPRATPAMTNDKRNMANGK